MRGTQLVINTRGERGNRRHATVPAAPMNTRITEVIISGVIVMETRGEKRGKPLAKNFLAKLAPRL